MGRDEVRRALAEDGASRDVTTQLLRATADEIAEVRFEAEGRCIVAGVPVVATVFQELDPRAIVTTPVAEGDAVAAGTTIATVRAPARVLLAGERVALNFLQRLCGIATITRQAVDAVAGTNARITHTRKTTPGIRALELYAVRTGGGVANRTSLADAILWKDNHWALLARAGGSLKAALRDLPRDDHLAVEVESEPQLEEALAAGVKHLLIDNQPPERLAAWARRAGSGVTIQASGGITPENARAYAEAGASLIAIGALTHSAPSAPMRCEIIGPAPESPRPAHSGHRPASRSAALLTPPSPTARRR